jgi:hypothetical protein
VYPPSEFRTIVNSSLLVRTPIGVFDVLVNVPLSMGCGACAPPDDAISKSKMTPAIAAAFGVDFGEELILRMAVSLVDERARVVPGGLA